MKTMFAIYDKVAGVYGNPMFEVNTAVMVRGLSDECRRDGSAIAQHPADYALYGFGSFDETSGVFTVVTPFLVVEVSSLVEPPA